MTLDFDVIVALLVGVFVLHAHRIGQSARQSPTVNCGYWGKNCGLQWGDTAVGNLYEVEFFGFGDGKGAFVNT